MKKAAWIFTVLFALITVTVSGASDIPQYSGKAYAVINGNKPYFTLPYVCAGDVEVKIFENYSALDSLNRCGQAFASICAELMPTTKRSSIRDVKPTGWHSVKYDFISGKYLYNRCHLIGRQLAGEDANEKNLITGTRYMNTEGMLPFENMVADYVKETGNHVFYRVTPYFNGNDLVADGVLIEAQSVEDNGEGICFNVYCYNVQPGVAIDYRTGESGEERDYLIEREARVFHLSGCAAIDEKKYNIDLGYGALWEFISYGFIPCDICIGNIYTAAERQNG